MEIFVATVNIAIGLVLLVLGGELLVRGACALARSLRVSPLVIGLTVVAFGTSAPEMAVSGNAALNNAADVAVGNVVGSNLFNILFILGISAIVSPLVISSQLVRRELPLMILSAVLMYFACANGSISQWEGITGLVLLVIWTVWLIVTAKRSEAVGWHDPLTESAGQAGDRPSLPGWQSLLLAIGGLVILVIGANRMVAGAVSVARMMEVSELIIGLTIVAVGTSLPEVVASVMASLKGERDLAAGNIVGSNVFNTLGVMGLAGVISPQPIVITEQSLNFDLPVMLVVSFACLPIFFSGVIARWEGMLFFAYYGAYVVYLFLDQTDSIYQKSYQNVMLVFVVPLTLVTLSVSMWGSWRIKRSQGKS